MFLLLTCIVGLLLVIETPASAVAQTITNNADGDIFCNGRDVIFTCETRGSSTLTWRSNNIYIPTQIGFAAAFNAINDTMSGSSSDILATLIQNDEDSGVRVLVSTLRITVSSVAPNGFVRCIVANGTEKPINFAVIAPPATPQVVVTLQLKRDQEMCAIASVLQGPTNPVEADATTYNVSVNGSYVSYDNAEYISSDGRRHFALVYQSSCGAHNISISASNICGDSPGTYETMLDPEQLFMFNKSLSGPDGGTGSIKCSVMTVIVGVVMTLFKYLLDSV